jgi:probable phosphoglycerate mutase
MKLVFVRHGDKEKGNFPNPEIRHNDQPLSVLGLAQSQALAEYLLDFRPARLFASRYRRTAQTLEPFRAAGGFQVTIDPRLDEIDIGILDGMSDEDIARLHPEFWNALTEMNRDFRFPEGETGEEARARIASFLEDRIAEGGDCLCASHDGLIRLMLCHLLGMPTFRRPAFRADTCGIFEIDYEDETGTWKILKANQSAGNAGAPA